jgi:hypothetical protein
MPHASLKLIPGVDQNRTPALNETAISNSQLIRFVPDARGVGLPQKLGGWLKYPNRFATTIGSIVRNLWAWSDIDDKKHLSIGAEASLSVITDAVAPAQNITPRTLTDNVPVFVETVQGSPVVTITDGGNQIENVTGASGDGVTATVTFTGPYTFPVGSTIFVSGVNPVGYNGYWVATASTATSVSFLNSETDAYVSSGTVENASNITEYIVVNIVTQISVGGLVLFGTYQCYADLTNKYQIIARDALGTPTPALFTTSTISVTGASGTGSLATLTYAFLTDEVPGVGSWITVSDVDPAGYNGSFIVQASTATSLSYDSAETAAYVTDGDITNYGTVPLFETVADSPVVTVTLPYHGYVVGDNFPILVPITVGGIVLNSSANQGTNYTIISVIDNPSGGPSAQFTIQGPTNATSTTANPEPLNNGNAIYTYYVGLTPPPTGAGFGDGPFGLGPFGYGVTPAIPTGAPITASDWTLDNWGSILVACPIDTDGFGGPIYTWNPTANQQNAVIIPEAPISNDGILVSMERRQIVAWGSTENGIQDHLLIRWCDIQNYNQWIDLPTNQAGSYRLPRGSRIVQIIQASQQNLIWTDVGLWAMQYINLPYVYSFNEIGTGCGLIGRKAACAMNGVVYWMSQSQFYKLSSSGVEVIYCPIWDVIFQDLDTTNLDKIRAAPNSRFGEITWFYPTISNNGEPSAYVKHNVNMQQWDYNVPSASTPAGGKLERTAWTNQSVLGAPIGAGPDPISGNNFIYQHEFLQPEQQECANADTIAMNSSFQTGYFVLNEATEKMFVDQVWPDMKWGTYGDQTPNANVSITFYVADYPGQTPVAYGPFTMTQATTFLTPRFRGRLVSIKIESNDVDSFWRLGNIRYRLQPDGRF